MCVSVPARARERASLGKLSNMQRGGLITRRFEAVAASVPVYNMEYLSQPFPPFTAGGTRGVIRFTDLIPTWE